MKQRPLHQQIAETLLMPADIADVVVKKTKYRFPVAVARYHIVEIPLRVDGRKRGDHHMHAVALQHSYCLIQPLAEKEQRSLAVGVLQ